MITPTKLNYHFICKRKLWLFSHDLSMEQTSELVALGQLLHELTYKKENKSIMLGSAKFDFIKRGDKIVINEVKKSDKIEEAHKWQLLYYLYLLKKRGIEAEGLLRYPKLRKIEKVELTEEKEQKLKQILSEIRKITNKSILPPPIKKPYCKKCSYYELCFA